MEVLNFIKSQRMPLCSNHYVKHVIIPMLLYNVVISLNFFVSHEFCETVNKNILETSGICHVRIQMEVALLNRVVVGYFFQLQNRQPTRFHSVSL
jgi:hypothetical protein